jgi:hypothetical protein
MYNNSETIKSTSVLKTSKTNSNSPKMTKKLGKPLKKKYSRMKSIKTF